MKRFTVAALAVLAAAILAGCGGGGGVSKEEFESTMGSVGDSIAESFQSLAESAPSATSFDELSDQLNQVKSDLEGAAGELDSLEFPEDIADTKDQLISGVEALAGDVQGLIDAVESGDLTSIQDAAAEFQNLDLSSLTDIQEAIEQIQAAGYDVGGE
jgi:hypothetical protein